MHPACILIEEGKIRSVTGPGETPGNVRVEDLGSLVVMPGLVDSHVHCNEPGRTDWEGFDTATKAAAAGGITTIVDMPLNSSPVTTTVDALLKKRKSAESKLHIDCGFYGGIVPGNPGEIEALAGAGVLGFKAFLIHSGIDDFPNVSEADLRTAMPVIARCDLPLLVHCELPGDGNSGAGESNPRSHAAWLASRPRAWEHAAIGLMIRLSREFACKVHIVHVSSSDAIPLLRDARRAGLPVTTETCPHYLCFTSEEIADGDTRFKCAPPIRESENRDRLWDALSEGTLDAVVSDHSPSPPAMKCLETGDFQRAWGGISSLQFGLPAIWTEARRRGFSLPDVAQWMCRRPAEIAGIGSRKGSIKAGADADLVIFDPDGTITVSPVMIYHRHKLTPYEGRTLTGVVERTILRGRTVFDRGRIAGTCSGRMITPGAAR